MAGMLFAMVIGLVAVPNAGAAEIPPTATCVKTSKKLFRQYFEKLKKDDSDKATKKADSELAQSLFDAGCVSDVEPLLKPMAPKPFSKQCVAAAKAADGYLTPASARFTKTARRFEKRLKPFSRRINRLDRQIRKLRSQGASPRRIRSVARVRKAVIKRRTRVSRQTTKQLFRFLERETFPTLLTLYELISLRCLDPELDYVLENEQKGPAARVAHKNGGLIYMSAIYLFIRYHIFEEASSASASRLSAPALTPSNGSQAGLEIPLLTD